MSDDKKGGFGLSLKAIILITATVLLLGSMIAIVTRGAFYGG